MLEETPKSQLVYLYRDPQLNLRKPPALVLLPGYNITEEDFLHLAKNFDERLLIISLQPPIQSSGKHVWFNMDRVGPVSFVNVVEAEYSRVETIKFIREAVRTQKIDPDQVYLSGYSQGAVIALSVFLSEPDLCAGLVFISGQAPVEFRSLIRSVVKLKKKPVLQLHGLQDNIYPISIGRAAGLFLASLPVRYESKIFSGMDHSLNQECLKKTNEWLANNLDSFGIFGLPNRPAYETSLVGVHLKVRDLEKAVNFYIRFLGMDLVERVGRTYAFLTYNSSLHHVIALQNIGKGTDNDTPERAGLHAVRFEVANQFEFAKAFKNLTEAGIKVTLIDHIICWEMHFHDFDGNGIDIFWDTRNLPGKSHLWQGRDLPLEPNKILELLEQDAQQS